jgi:hypothetical protein
LIPAGPPLWELMGHMTGRFHQKKNPYGWYRSGSRNVPPARGPFNKVWSHMGIRLGPPVASGQVDITFRETERMFVHKKFTKNFLEMT